MLTEHPWYRQIFKTMLYKTNNCTEININAITSNNDMTCYSKVGNMLTILQIKTNINKLKINGK